MFSEVYYLVRSKIDGSYLVAHPKANNGPGYLLMFREYFDALSYLKAHAADLADKFGVESLPGSQLKGLLNRWGFVGVGMVQDPLLPRIEFLSLQ
ncbi:MAG: hypothetical protein N3E45_13145 [Oscillatoriaceae bacterium SKW80]|nr:hypothetical protein [Oscillatoriaceae bacterium SKYG93]MCX8121747.1 hypothetical protein [Oscillatoriaceae bacterium SKW80]MDW8453637.1 hypothetical protein [Oscillatoriaceae cyanobacterium SKYGB_i_bin93]HIK28702.1 hypothetical protein [Oscillatoriaceae cyanobacterium M7585_C2015_266]